MNIWEVYTALAALLLANAVMVAAIISAEARAVGGIATLGWRTMQLYIALVFIGGFAHVFNKGDGGLGTTSLTADTTGNYAAADPATGDALTSFFSAASEVAHGGNDVAPFVSSSTSAGALASLPNSESAMNHLLWHFRRLAQALRDGVVALFSLFTVHETAGGQTSVVQINGLDGNDSSLLVTRSQNSIAPPRIFLAKSRGATVGAYDVVHDGDQLGQLEFFGSDGTDFAAAATVQALVDGTPSNNNVPGRLSFRTTNGGTTAERWNILSAGHFVPFADGAYDIGTSDALRVRNMYMNGTQLALDNNTALRFYEADTGGDNYIAFVAPSALSGNITCTLENDSSPIPGACAPPQAITVAASDETTPITSGEAKVRWRMPYAFTVTGLRCGLTTSQSSGGGKLFTVDIKQSGTSILSTKLTFDDGEKTTTTATTTAVVSDSSLADDAEMSIDVDSVGRSADAAGLKCSLIGYN